MKKLEINHDYISPNYNERQFGDPSMVIIHYTGMTSSLAALERLCSKDAEVSAHYLINEQGDIYQLVDEEKRAWHAGLSYWNGEVDINSLSIGIELVNKGHELGYENFPKPQMENLIALCQMIKKKYSIQDKYFLGHSDIAPDRKIDPGEKFDWKLLSQNGLGLWPELEENQNLKDSFSKDQLMYYLKYIGYGMRKKTDTQEEYHYISKAFQRHYQPQRINEEPNIETLYLAKKLYDLQQAK